MAVKKLAPVKAPYNEITKVVTEAQSATSDGYEINLARTQDEYLVILVQDAGSGGTVTLKKPTKGHYAAAKEDKTLSIGAGELAVIRIETAKYANKNGTVNVATSAATLKVHAIC